MVAETLTLPTQLALRAVVAELLEGPLESLQLSQGRFVMPGNPPRTLSVFCALATEVEVNPDTGQVTVTKVVTAHDSTRSCIP